MLDWLKSLFRDAGIVNRVNLPKNEVELLKKDFEVLDKEKPGISGRLLRYLLDDEGDDVLSELATTPKAGELLQLGCMNNVYIRRLTLMEKSASRFKFFKETDCKDPGFWYRLGRIYGSASQNGSRTLYCKNFPQGLEWLEVLIREILQYDVYRMPDSADPKIGLNASTFEQIALYGGEHEDTFVRGFIFADATDYLSHTIKEMFLAVPGIAESFSRHTSVVLEALDQPQYQNKLYVIEMLAESKTSITPFLEKLTSLAVGSSKQVRAAAEKLLLSKPEEARPIIEHFLKTGNASERFYAIKLLWKTAGEECRDVLERRMQEDKSKKVKNEIENILQFEAAPASGDRTQAADPAPSSETFDLSPVTIPEAFSPLPTEIKGLLEKAIIRHNQESTANWQRQPPQNRSKYPGTIDLKKTNKAFELLQSLTIDKSTQLNKIQNILQPRFYDDKSLGGFFELILRPEIELIHLVRLLVLMDFIQPGNGISFQGLYCLNTFRRNCMPELDLRQLAAVFTVIGLDERILVAAVLFRSSWHSTLEWGPKAFWPFFAENLDFMEEAFGLKPSPSDIPEYWRSDIRRQAFSILQAFPHIPQQFIPMLWELALGTGKSERYEAQACLNSVPDKAPRIIAALKDGKKDVRAVAAEWLGELGCKEAIPALEEALKKEKHEEPKGMMMRTLERLGVPIEQFMDVDKLAKEAEKGLGKGIPAKLQWFPFDRLPQVRWQKRGDTVAPDILRWFLLQSFKLKNPEPGPLLRLYCSYFNQSDKEALGKFVLEQWIAEDTKPRYTHEEATVEAEKQMQQIRSYVTQFPQHYPNWDEEKQFQSLLNNLLTTCLGSATPSKGILAIASVCCNADVAPLIERYLKQWYGQRAAQCKSLLQVLVWIDHPSAIQLLLSVSNRFRTKSIQHEATQHVQALAERKGWTMDELADRTIPHAGFDQDGQQELDYGERRFTLSLGEDMKILIRNDEGKTIKGLPQARKSEDPEQVKEAKKQLSNARKELKNVLKMQKERLYEAMCVQRAWQAADWRTYLNEHPIVGRYCQQLVWIAYRDDELIHSFRPLEDRSLSDVDDEEVILQENDSVRLAHKCLLPEEICRNWLEHFRDYEIAPLFPQFGRAPFELTDELKAQSGLSDFEGHLLSSFALRGKATKLGYTRGQAEDAGWFYFYHKDFPGQSLRATIEFTGNFLPEEERTVALRQLFFTRLSPEQQNSYSWSVQKLQLEKVPPVLLVECWNDLRSIAAEGSGYDPDWEKKSEY